MYLSRLVLAYHILFLNMFAIVSKKKLIFLKIEDFFLLHWCNQKIFKHKKFQKDLFFAEYKREFF